MMPLLTLFLTTVLLQTCVVLDILFDIERQNIRDLFLCTSSTQPYKCTARTAVVLTDSFVPNAWLKEIISPSVQFYQPVLTQQMFYNCTYNSGEKQSLE